MEKVKLVLWMVVGVMACDPGSDVQEKSLNTLTGIQDVWQQYPNKIRGLVKNMGRISGSYSEALSSGDTLAACEILLEHYQNTDRSWVLSTLSEMSDFEKIGNDLLADTLELAGKRERIPSDASGGWKWNYTGIVRDDEFGYSLNGHKYLPSLYYLHHRDQDQKYIEKFDRIIQDWILTHPLPPEGDSIYVVLDTTKSVDWRDIGEVEWRTLEAGNRLGASWPALFYAFQHEQAFSEATRLLILASIADQAEYLRQYHKSRHNWTTMEMNGLALAGLAFPEFTSAQEWTNYALAVMSDEINRQVYPDGVQTEISTKTQWVALNRFESLAENFQKAGQEVSTNYRQRLEEMYDYLAYCMRPDGHQPMNNDSDREDLRPRVISAASRYHRPDWIWVATNGLEGEKPDQDPTRLFPWGGIHIMRNGWHEEAHWAFLDIGPYGTGHQHRDKLHLSISAFGQDFLVDAGRFTHQDYFSFDPVNWRGYFRSSYSHNVILVDGHGQKASNIMAAHPLEEGKDFAATPAYDYSWGSFDDGYEQVEGNIRHRRSVIYLKNKFWVVFDQLKTDRPREIQALWHFHPDHPVVIKENSVLTENSTGPNLQIIPAGDLSWQTEIIRGQESPTRQGWYSADYGAKVPNPTAQYSATITQAACFAWLIVPSANVLPMSQIQMKEKSNSIEIHIVHNESPVTIDLPKDGNASKVKMTGR
ncbi:MAG: alginate lyase family protein [Saprospiraceae bacterium]|nr:alginate lyase family protein [Saprospiraceae bacterium]